MHILASWFTLLRRILFYAVMTWVLLFASVVVALRWWILPNIDQYRPSIEAKISQTLGQKVAIRKVESGWIGLRPHLRLEQVVVHDQTGSPALAFDHIDTTLSWYSLLVVQLRLHRLEITRPRFELKRETNGLIYVTGFTHAINDPTTPHDFGNWILNQESIQLNHATLEWRDYLRGAEPLLLTDVGLRLVNSGKHHRFGFVANAPKELASTFDVRGDFHGTTFERWHEWSGDLYTNLGTTNLTAWHAWVDLPYAFSQGTGAMQLWSAFKQGRPVGLSAQVQLQKVRARLGQKLPELELAQLAGHLAWRELPKGFVFESKRLELDAGPGKRFSTKNLFARYSAAFERQAEQGELRAESLSIAPLLALSEYLPLSDAQRNRLKEASPQGTIKSLALKWTGPAAKPDDYSIKAEFERLGIQALGKLPGFTNVSGVVEADTRAGSLKLIGKQSVLDMPQVFRQALPLDAVNLTAHWRNKNQLVQLTIDKADFSNAHLQGNVIGTYEALAEGPGRADLEGRLTRADATAVYLYLPRFIGEKTQQWVQSAVVKGSSDDVRVKVKGRLEYFPFVDDRNGVFQVTAKVKDGILQYVADWPRIEQVQANLDFHGARMDILGAQGTIFKTRISRAKIAIPDLAHRDPVLEVDGETLGPTLDHFRFINESPIGKDIDNLTAEMRAEGDGKLTLSLRLPLQRLQESQVVGSYQFQGNRVLLAANAPALEKVIGKLDFTGHSIAISKITAQALGGPVNISSRTTADGVLRVGVAGRMSAEGLQRAYPGPWTQRLQGGADWSASLAMRKSAVNVVLVSSLVGLTSELPYPLAKAANESMPLKFERRFIDAGHDALLLSLGKQLSAHLQRDTDKPESKIVKGRMHFGALDATPTQAGVWIDGELEKLDADLWRNLLHSSEDEPPLLPLAGVQLQIKELDFLGRRINHFKMDAHNKLETWQASVASDEMLGDVNWRGQAGGRLVARFKRLVYPEASPARGVKPAGGFDLELPALDIVIDDMKLKKANFGKVELLANKQGNDWRIEQLRISNPDATLNADGVWQSWLAQPQTKMKIDLEVKEVGKFLARLGYPERIRGGTAKLNGNYSWRGSPQDFNLATLGGEMKLDARQGQFMKIDPGVGKLLGLLSLQALPRRLTLDFRDVFSEGFAFDSILGVMSVNQGVLSTNDFVMQGPAAVVTMSGATDLDKETQVLRVKVVPVVGDSVSLLAFLGGPVVGIGTFVLQKLLKDPLGKFVAYDYAVSGTWGNPLVVKAEKPKESAQ